MSKSCRTLLAAMLFASSASLACAESIEIASVTPDPSSPAIGAWIGHVSWNPPIVSYGWTLNADGTFSSGRLGRGESGGGEWSARGTHLTLKYSDRVHYEGELRGNTYSGTAYTAEGRTLGGFSMSREIKAPDDVGDDGE